MLKQFLMVFGNFLQRYLVFFYKSIGYLSLISIDVIV